MSDFYISIQGSHVSMSDFYISIQGVSFYTQTKTITSLWREEDVVEATPSTVFPTLK